MNKYEKNISPNGIKINVENNTHATIKATLYLAVPLYSIPSGQYTTDIVAQAALVATAVEHIIVTQTAKDKTSALVKIPELNIAGVKQVKTTIFDTALLVKLVKIAAMVNPIKMSLFLK